MKAMSKFCSGMLQFGVHGHIVCRAVQLWPWYRVLSKHVQGQDATGRTVSCSYQNQKRKHLYLKGNRWHFTTGGMLEFKSFPLQSALYRILMLLKDPSNYGLWSLVGRKFFWLRSIEQSGPRRSSHNATMVDEREEPYHRGGMWGECRDYRLQDYRTPCCSRILSYDRRDASGMNYLIQMLTSSLQAMVDPCAGSFCYRKGLHFLGWYGHFFGCETDTVCFKKSVCGAGDVFP